jgi:hypothetical protein
VSLVYIYGLTDPDAPEVIRYIGQSIDPQARLKGHLSEGRSTVQSARAVWIRQLMVNGKEPLLHILATADELTAEQTEREHIALHAGNGRLVNTSHNGHQKPARRYEKMAPLPWHITLHLSAEVGAEIDRWAERDHVPASTICRMLIRERLEQIARSQPRTPKEEQT